MKVSILIPCLNAERHIERAIDSALEQTVSSAEVIVVDDGSTDGSWERICGYGDRIRAETGPNRGSNPARNRLLELAQGEWVQYLDADDELLPHKIARQLDQRSDCADVLYGPVLIEEDSADGGAARTVSHMESLGDPWRLLVHWQLPQTGGCLWRREALQRLGGWNEQQRVCQEHELYFRALAAGLRFERTTGAEAVYRVWSEATLCRRDPLQTLRAKMAIVDRIADTLEARGELTRERREAVAYARFESARNAYPLDPGFAAELYAAAGRIAPGYRPPVNPVFPRPWQLICRSFGFRAAETVAAWRRRFFSAH